MILQDIEKQSVDYWHAPAVIAENHFVFKSLSNWAFNVAVGCSHACRFCYVPSAATIKQGPKLARVRATDRYVERSEEHTSELQSQSNLVCRLLLEKKKWMSFNNPSP